jgi:hypothetical protein
VCSTLHPLVAVSIDYKQPATVKNHNEMLRCFEVLGMMHDRLEFSLINAVMSFSAVGFFLAIA